MKKPELLARPAHCSGLKPLLPLGQMPFMSAEKPFRCEQHQKTFQPMI